MPYRLSVTFIYGFIRQSLDVYRHVYCGGSCNVVIIWHIDESVPEIALFFEAMLVHCFLLFGTFCCITVLEDIRSEVSRHLNVIALRYIHTEIFHDGFSGSLVIHGFIALPSYGFINQFNCNVGIFHLCFVRHG